MSATCTTRPGRFHRRLLAAALVGFAALVLWTIPDYGLMWDAWEYHAGDKYLRFYGSFDTGYFDFQRDDLSLYDGVGHPDFYRVTNAYAQPLFRADPAFARDLDHGRIPMAIRAELERRGVALPPRTRVLRLQRGARWSLVAAEADADGARMGGAKCHLLLR